jgi:hypothetical protein
MANNIDIQGLLRQNPQLDEEMLSRCRQMLELLRKARITKKQYDLASPLDQRPLLQGEEDVVDSRTIDLTFLRSW